MKARLPSDRKKTKGTRCSNCRRIAPNYDIINRSVSMLSLPSWAGSTNSST
jgi:hypothetical protein